MMRSRFFRLLLPVLCFCMISLGALAQSNEGTEAYEPEVHQEGKDVVWVPTAQALVDLMLDMAKVTPKDYVIDLGSGDGRTVISAAKRGARALGIEYNPDMVALSRRNAVKEGVADRARFEKADLFETDFSRATVVTMFLLPTINAKLRPKILALKPGTRIVSNTFDMGEWMPDRTENIDQGERCTDWCTALLWIVPARVEGSWKLPRGQLDLSQSFQMVTGTLKTGDRTEIIAKGMLTGDRIEFFAGQRRYTGVVRGNVMEGRVASKAGARRWRASRREPLSR